MKTYFICVTLAFLAILVYGGIVPFLVSDDSWISLGFGAVLAVAFPAAVFQYLKRLK